MGAAHNLRDKFVHEFAVVWQNWVEFAQDFESIWSFPEQLKSKNNDDLDIV